MVQLNSGSRRFRVMALAAMADLIPMASDL